MDYTRLTGSDIPDALTHIPDPPEQLYVAGTLPDPDTKLLAVVGSRKCTSYGQSVTEFLIDGLSPYPVSIVSGLALGIDGHAHVSALRAGLHTIAIPGSGLDASVLYPRSHTRLAQHILDAGGALISEYEPTTPAAPWTFPKRNRIMAGLADAVLIIEATHKSGTLITARLATEYNKDVLAVPSSIFADSSKGAHQFIKLGAQLVTHPDDIVEALGLIPRTTRETTPTLSADEHVLYDLLAEPRTKDELITACALPVHHVQVLISKLELDGVIIERGGVFRRC